jgi:AcrR family transcriptional regulator
MLLTMGNREKLLAGAKQCLLEKGYARTTARDIAAAAGVSLAAIGYHFKTTEALLNAALFEAIGEWGAELRQVLSTEDDGAPAQRFERTWTRVIESLCAHPGLWSAQFELVTLLEHQPELRRFAAEAQPNARPALLDLLDPLDDTERDDDTRRKLGTLYQALLAGVAVQWLVSPEHAPAPRDLVDAIRILGRELNE